MLGADEDSLYITKAQSKFAGVSASATTLTGTCIGFLALVAYAIAAFFPQARKPLDRVSVRLLVYNLVFSVLFGTAYASIPTSPGPRCDFYAFALNFTWSFSTFFTTCIAINLQLVLVHGVDGKMMEKYYVIVTTIVSTTINIPTFALHQFGWDEDLGICWFKNPHKHLRLRWLIGTETFWISFAAIIETFCSCVVLVWIFRSQSINTRLWRAFSNRTTTSNPNDTRFTKSSICTFVLQSSQYRKVILRIALYPIISFVVTYSTVVLDLNMTLRGIHTGLDFRLQELDLVLYGVRTLAYGVVAFIDPSFVRAIREVRGSRDGPIRGRTATRIVFADLPTSSQDEESQSALELHLPQNIHPQNPRNECRSQDSDVHQELQADYAMSDINFEELRNFERQL